ncbi:hypothetical protein C2845_PM07G05760 [Panicum miliaceum]|uniref:Dof-type domain-containing protein n=1 Tax=Panicum miliaceum TaxID=4540 RepID=A0A3L6SLM2_PANMI|nr:hypothetical protein C2845_PM07G05760 [Panicum miliaceum]
MSDLKDPGIKLFGRVIPLATPEPALGTTETEEPPCHDQPPEELQPRAQEEEEEEAAADEDQHNEKEDSEMKVDTSQEKDNEMKVDTPQEKGDEMKVDTPQEKGNEMKVDMPQEEKGTEMKFDASEKEQDGEMKVDAQQEKKDEQMKVDASPMTENIQPNTLPTSDHNKEDLGRVNSTEDKAASDPKGESEKTSNEESGQDKTLKKPDKILPCPRCNSMDTKFCYYNNYNVNQPRHFCKNCQRYWTAGGTMRNVPVGAGRRKSKNASLHYRQLLMAPDCMLGSRVDISKSVLPEALVSPPSAPIQPTSRNETVLKFGPEVPLCESMASALNIDEQNVKNPGSAPRGENREGNSCASSVTSYNGLPENMVHVDKNGAPVYCNGVAPLPQYYLGTPFMYPWSVGWNNLPVMVPDKNMPESASASESCSTSSAPWMTSPMMPASRLPGPAFPYPLVPPALWGCLSGWPATTWNIPWIRTNGCVSLSASSNSSCSGNGSPTLGKHSRDSNPLKEEKKEKSLWVPKTLRIDDPDEAAKSSIWATLGIKPGDPGTFKPFQSKVESKSQKSDTAQVLQANPAALSRSQSFQESS